MIGSSTVRILSSTLVLGVSLVAISVAPASPMGEAAVEQVSQQSYTDFLDNWLFTHVGDNRGPSGPDLVPARNNIRDLMLSYGLSVTLEPFTYSGGTYHNVVATQVGTVYPDQEYIIGAHYDSVSNPGADDNASGTALVLEAARILSQYDSEYTIRYIAFSMEEVGLEGSEAYVANHTGDDIRAMISADMVAYDTGSNEARIYSHATSSALMNALGSSIMMYGEGITWMDAGWISASDHNPFDAAGYQACLLIEGEVWDNPYYHTQDDNFENPNNLNLPYAVKMTRSVVGYLVDQAGVMILVHNGDIDFDGLVTSDDYAAFEACLFGPDELPDPAAPLTEAECLGAFDFDRDDDVDLADYHAFAAVFGLGDCNDNMVLDERDISGGTSEDCNANTVPDECDITAGTSLDCQPDAIPDECQLEVIAEAQDRCADAQPVCPGITYTGSTSGASSDGESSCGSSSSTADMWFSYTPETGGSATFSLCDGTSYDAVMSVHSGCPGTSSNDLDCDDDGCGGYGVPSTLALSVSAGTTYLIRITGYYGATGSFGLEITGPACEPVGGGDCNDNQVPDECDIASGYSDDTNGNDIPDECE